MTTVFRKAVFARDGRLRTGWCILLFVLLLNLLGIALTPVIRAWPKGWQGWLPGRWFEVGLALLVSWACLRLECKPLAALGLRWDRTFLKELVLGTLGGVALIGLMALLIRGADAFHWVRNPGVGLVDLLRSAWFFLAVAAFEEVIFRGYPFQRAVDGLGTPTTLILSAAVFALAHWWNPGMHGATKAWATLNIGLAAILLGFCYLRTRSLALPIGVHLGWNWAQGSLLGFGVSGTSFAQSAWEPVSHGRPEWLTGGAFGLEASLPGALVCTAAILFLWRGQGRVSGGASTASAS